MTLQEFRTAVDAHEKLKFLGAFGKHGDEQVAVQHDDCLVTELPVDAILGHGWEELEAVLTAKRPAKIMRGYSRIVGYFSQMRNWNPSKLAELRDRQKGEYTVPEGGE